MDNEKQREKWRLAYEKRKNSPEYKEAMRKRSEKRRKLKNEIVKEQNKLSKRKQRQVRKEEINEQGKKILSQ